MRSALSCGSFTPAYPIAVPGTAMGYAGVKDPRERADLIAYLEAANLGPECKAAK